MLLYERSRGTVIIRCTMGDESDIEWKVAVHVVRWWRRYVWALDKGLSERGCTVCKMVMNEASALSTSFLITGFQYNSFSFFPLYMNTSFTFYTFPFAFNSYLLPITYPPHLAMRDVVELPVLSSHEIFSCLRTSWMPSGFSVARHWWSRSCSPASQSLAVLLWRFVVKAVPESWSSVPAVRHTRKVFEALSQVDIYARVPFWTKPVESDF